jgi:monoamine oxidase
MFFALLLITFMKMHAEEKKITVVGAGLAGLTAAYRIEQMTHQPVEVFEARNRPGGRVYTVYVGDSYEELGGKFISDAEEAPHIKALVQEMGLEIETQIVDLGKRKYFYKGKVGNFYSAILENQPDELLLSYEQFNSWAQKANSIGEVLDIAFRDQPLLRHFAELRSRNFDGNDSKDLSAAYADSFWEAFESNYQTAKGILPSLYELSYVKGGNSLLIKKLTESLQGTIHYNRPLRKISKSGGRICLVFEGEKEVITDSLILAIPCSTLREVEIERGILPEDQKFAIETLQYGTNAKVLLPISIDEADNAPFNIAEDLLI